MSIINMKYFSSIEHSGTAGVMTLLYLLKGKVQFSIQNKSYMMEKQDITVEVGNFCLLLVKFII